MATTTIPEIPPPRMAIDNIIQTVLAGQQNQYYCVTDPLPMYPAITDIMRQKQRKQVSASHLQGTTGRNQIPEGYGLSHNPQITSLKYAAKQSMVRFCLCRKASAPFLIA